MLYTPLFGLVQSRPQFPSSMWISSVAGVQCSVCLKLVVRGTPTYVRMLHILQLGANFSQLSHLANGVIYFLILDFAFISFRRWMDGLMERVHNLIGLRGTGTKNVKWWLDDKGEILMSHS